jgi:FkbM family methyltransferase
MRVDASGPAEGHPQETMILAFERAMVKLGQSADAKGLAKGPLRIVLALLRRLGVVVPWSARTFFGERMAVLLPEHVSAQIFLTTLLDGEVPVFLCRILSPGDIFFDVGSHFGFYSLLAAALVGPGGRVHSFEPTPSSFKMLRRNVAGRDNILINECAVAAHDGYSWLADFGPVGLAFNKIVDSETEIGSGQRNKVRAQTLDTYCATTGVKPKLVKIDTEGHETPCLLGCRRTIATSRPAFILEYGMTSGTALDPFVFLNQQGYVLHGASGAMCMRVGMDSLSSAVAGSNFLMLPEEWLGMV